VLPSVVVCWSNRSSIFIYLQWSYACTTIFISFVASAMF